MKVAIHSNQLDGRGTGKTPYDYAVGLRDYLGHEVVMITSSRGSNDGARRIAEEFPVLTYDRDLNTDEPKLIQADIERLVDAHRIDFVQMLKYGHDDKITPSNCRSGVHCVFIMTQPHGSVYAAVSKTLARKFGQTLNVPHIVTRFDPTEDIRAKYHIPKEAFVFGRHGGPGTFDIPFVHQSVAAALNMRKDLYFLFLSTHKFIEHERVIHIPWVESEQDKFNVIHACDAMLHGRLIGETFGIAVGEFAISNKPVVTWSGKGFPAYDTAHIDILGSRALLYNNGNDLLSILLKIEKRMIEGKKWDVYSQAFGQKSIMDQYRSVFLEPAPVTHEPALAGATPSIGGA